MSEWREYTIGDICSKITSGGTPNTRKNEYYGGEIPWVRTQEVNFNRIYDAEIKITEDGLNNSSAKWIPENSVIIAMYGATAGKVAINKIPVTTNQACCNLIINNDKADYRFVYYNILSRFSNIANMAVGGAQQNLNAGMIKDLPVFLPDLHIQTAIAEILSSLDDKIELNNKINLELENLAQTLFKRWFIDFEFPNENGESYKSSGGEMVDSELGEIPKGWEVGRFGDLVDIINGYAFKSKDFNDYSNEGILKIRNINGVVVDIVNTDFVSSDVVCKLNSKFKVNSGDILIAMTGAEVGKIGVTPKSDKTLWLNQRVGKFVPKNKDHVSFIHTMYNILNFTEIVKNEALGSAQPNISSQGIECIKLILPSTNLINEFSSMFIEKFELFYKSLGENQELVVLRDTLLPKLISGEIEVKQVLSQTT
jgi:type I restriction enzyme S subunit